jgi:hypothetical protein
MAFISVPPFRGNQDDLAALVQAFPVVIILLNGNLDNSNIRPGANIDATKLLASSITATQIATGAVGTTQLAANAVTTAKILDANVTAAKIAAEVATNWTPTISVGGGLTFSSAAIVFANSLRYGNMVYYELYVTGTVGGTLTGYITFTTPTTMARGANTAGGFNGYDENNTKAMFGYRDNATTFRVYHDDQSNYPAGGGGFHGSGFYISA